ncbi:MAG: hypothetical protein DDT31_01578 [Syntrophomonadaceae bacterium]|nr:hypothetical protein [Bacillota bacterium]
MSFDGITMAAVCHELAKELPGAKVEKVVQPRPLEIILHLRGRHKSFQLLCSADSHLPRIHLTESKPENPPAPPPFCMLLRKHLIGARYLFAEQSGLERILSLHFGGYDDFGNEIIKTLQCEVMGKHSNIILTMPRDVGTYILGSIKIVTEEMSRHRVVRPGEPYILPPVQNKLALFTLTEERLAEKLTELLEQPIEKVLVSAIMGLGPELAREITYRASRGDDAHPLEISRSLTIELRKLAEIITRGNFTPCLAQSPGSRPFFSPVSITSLAPEFLTPYPSVNQGLDLFFSRQLRILRGTELKQRLIQTVRSAISRNEKKRQFQEKELLEMAEADSYRIWGEMLTASINLISSGAKEVFVPNYYNIEQEKIYIPLNPALSPQGNIHRYFKKYRKLKDGEKILSLRLNETVKELMYLESLLSALTHAALEDLDEIREEMEQGGLIRERKTKKKTIPAVSTPLQFISVDGITIYVGKNNRQNDRLTLRDASPHDTWLHAKDIPGAHVIIKSSNPPEATLLEAACLAVRYSKAATSANVPVDYTLARHVRKPKSAKPGMVIYDHHRTIYITDFPS